MQTYNTDYHIHSHFQPHRRVVVHATPHEIAAFAEQGYLVREQLFSEEQTSRLKMAVDALAEEEMSTVGIS